VTDGESRFVEEMGQMLASYGMTPMAGRMWGWLLICEPEEQTAAEIADALHASRGAISGTARLLATSGMIRRSTRRGDRREYFSAPPETLDSFLASAGRMYSQFRALSERGLDAIADRPPESKRRIEELRDVFAFVEREVPAVIDRFLRERAGTAGREAGAAGREAGAAGREAGTAGREAGAAGRKE
jgi:DNA-binding transcriptional regulator GbsR (MarR family)